MKCNPIMMQGDSYPISFTITDENNNPLNIDEIDLIQFDLGGLIKMFTKDETTQVNYIEEFNQFQVPITQQESFNFNGEIDCQIRIKFTSGQVIGKKIGSIDLQFSSNEEIL